MLPKEGEGSVLGFYITLSKLYSFQQKIMRPTKKQKSVMKTREKKEKIMTNTFEGAQIMDLATETFRKLLEICSENERKPRLKM